MSPAMALLANRTLVIASRARDGYETAAMGDERRWAARYQFLEQLWRGRDRIVCDREIEAALHAGVEGPLAGLLETLLPADGGDARAWMALHNERRAASFARSRSGTVFASLDDAPEFAADEGWEVALVHLDNAPLEDLEAFLEILGERLDDDSSRSVVLSLDCGADEDATYETLADLVAEQFGDGRIYGLTRPQMAAFFDFGPVLEGEEADRGPSELELDNSLGSEEPRFELFVAVIGAGFPSEGTAYVELPGTAQILATGSQASRAEAEELAAVRVQLAELQRRADVQAIERQDLLEQLEHSEDRVASLEEALDAAELGDPPSQAKTVQASAGRRLDTALVNEQALRWELDRARGELENLRARPVDELEAEYASLRVQLDQAEELLRAALEQGEQLEQAMQEQVEQSGEGDDPDDEPSVAQARAWLAARGQLESLLRKLERGSKLSALDLHRELTGLHRLL